MEMYRSDSSNSLITTLFVMRTINSLGWSSTMPFFAVYLENSRHTPLSLIGVSYLLSGALTLVSQLAGGRLTDLYGSKPIMLFGYVSSIVSSAFTGYLIYENSNVLLLLTLYPLFSLLRGVSNPATSALLAAQPRKSMVQTGFSLQTMGGNLGFGFGPALGGFLADRLGYAAVFALSASTAATATIITLVKVHASSTPELSSGSHVPRALPDKWTAVLLLEVFGCYLVNGFTYTTLSLFAAGFRHTSNQELGYLFATNGFTIVALQLPLMRLIDRANLTKVSPGIGVALTGLAYLLVAGAKGFFGLEYAMLVSTLGEILISVPSQLLVTAKSQAGNRGVYQGYYAASSTLGRSLSNFIGPSVLGIYESQPGLAWYAAFGAGLFVAASYFASYRQVVSQSAPATSL
ncbi:MAG: MFS transporter [Thermoprotei archaeon]